jgi:uncharacterized membrane protein YhhN
VTDTHLWVLAAALGLTAVLNWAAVARGDDVVERITKPTFMLLLGGLAWGLVDAAPPGAPALAPVLAALGLSLVGDVALLNSTEGRFLLGLGSFLLAHVAWIWAIATSEGRGIPWWLLLAVPLIAVAHGRWGRHIVRHSGRQRGPVFLYLLALVALVLVAAWRGDPLVVAGAVLFLASDTILGHDRFVTERRWAPVQVMVSYHLAQVGLVLGLLS